jgi:YD repeat-containing protein
MTTLTIADYLKYVNLQMAAEAFLVNADGSLKADIVGALEDGNLHASKFTPTLANAFASQWEVVDQRANTPTGFAGTLFRSKADPTQYVISFRSTEFIDDAARDNQATNKLEIADKGWAFGQIDDMMAWFQTLRQKQLIPDGAHFSVTGYSLGGHLATAFNLLYGASGPQPVNQPILDNVVTFNGAGVGKVNQGDLYGVMAYFDTLRHSPTSIDNEISDAKLRSHIDAFRSKLDSYWKVNDVDSLLNAIADAKATIQADASGASSSGAMTAEQKLVWTALDRMASIALSARDDPKLPSGSTSPDPRLAHPLDVNIKDIAQAQFDYQMAVMLAGRRTQAIGVWDNATQMIFGRQPGPYLLTNQYDILGDTSLSAVANSQLHYGYDIRTFIEDQPDKRGSVVWDALMRSKDYWSIKLLVPNYTQNDFGDTHSLVLIVDSLSVQNALLSLVPDGQKASMANTLMDIFKKSSNAMESTDSDQGTADGESLDNIANALGEMILGDGKFSELNGNNQGNTWWEVDHYTGMDGNSYSGREDLQALLQTITTNQAFKDLANSGHVQVLTAPANGAVAKNDFGALLSLLFLSPFELSGTGLDTVWNEAQPALLKQWQDDQTADSSYSARSRNFSDQYLNARAGLNSRLMYYNALNARYDTSSGNDARDQLAEQYDTEDIIWEDRNYDVKIQRGGTTANTHYVIFGKDGSSDTLQGGAGSSQLFAGSDSTETLIGGANNDYLDGGRGNSNDTLKGGAGQDTLDAGNGSTALLVGGTGDDILIGGSGADTFQFAVGDGKDVIQGATAQDHIVIGNVTLTGGKAIAANNMSWQSKDDPTIKFTLIPTGSGTQNLQISYGNGDSILVKNYTQGALGITLDNYTAPPSTAPVINNSTTISGTSKTTTVNGQSFTYTDYQGDNNGDIVTAGDGPNNVHVGNGNNSVTGGAGNDTIYSGTGNSIISGGGGQDFIYTDGHGNNVINLNGGQDIVYTGYGNNQIYGDKQSDLGAAMTQAQKATATGSKGSFISVTDGNNTIVGGNGNDVITTGHGNNIVVAGPGNDVIVGGEYAGGIPLDWNVQLASKDGERIIEWGTVQVSTAGGYTASGTYDGNLGPDGKALGIGNNTIYGGAGNHVIALSNGDNYVDLGSGNSSVAGGMGADTIFGGSGNVSISGGGGDDYIDAESGNDTIFGGLGNNTIFGGSGKSLIYAGANRNHDWASTNGGNNYVEAGTGDTTIYGSGGNDTLVGGDGNDTIFAGDGNMTIEGGDGVMHIEGGAGSDVIYAGDGGTATKATEILAGKGNTTVYGGNGVDHIQGGSGNNELHAGDGGTSAAATYVQAGDGNTTIYGGAGVDVLVGGKGANVIYAGDGGSSTSPTKIFAGSGNTTVYGGAGIDSIVGGAGTDILYAGNGGTADKRTTVAGGSGDSTLVAGSGHAILVAGSGHTTFVLNGSGGDTVIQGKKDGDTIRFADSIAPTDVSATAQLYDDGSSSLILSVGGTTVTLMNGLSNGQFQFKDAGTLGLAQLLRQTSTTPQHFVGAGTELGFSATDGDTLTATTSNDTLYAFGANSTLVAGVGTSALIGGGGNATYVVSTATSKTSISNSTGTDTLKLGTGITAAEITATSVAGADGTITVTLAMADGGTITVTGIVGNMLSQVAFADGSTTTLAQLLTQSNGGTATVTNPDGSYSMVTNDGHGDITTTQYDKNAVKVGDTWQKADGSSGTDTFNADGTSSGTAHYADGHSSSYANDGQGQITTKNYDTTGTLTGTSITKTDALGNVFTTNFDVAGNKTSDSWTKTDGSSGSDVYQGDGSYSTRIKDPQGNVTITQYNSAGTKTKDTWTHADGSHGDDTFNSDGSSSGTSSGYPDGTSANYTDDGHGNKTIIISTGGVEIGDLWTKSDGSHGRDYFHSDGSSEGIVYRADGSYSIYSNDGRGGIETSDYDAQGNPLGDHVAASSGTSRVDNNDGSYKVISTDGKGNTTVMYYDSHGVKYRDSWTKSDGSHGSDFFSMDGSSTGNVYRADGTSSTYRNNGNGQVITTNYDWKGVLAGSVISETNGLNNVITTYRDAGGKKISETWVHSDGTSGTDAVSPLDFQGAANLLPPGGSDYSKTWAFKGADGSGNGAQGITSISVSGNGSYSAEIDAYVTGTFLGTDLGSVGYQIWRENWSTPDDQGDIAYSQFDQQQVNVSFDESESANGSKVLEGWVFLANGSMKLAQTAVAGGASSPLTMTLKDLKGNSSTYTDDGQGNVTIVNYDANGVKLGDMWIHNDASYGFDVFNPDGSSKGIVSDKTGRAVTFTNDGHGHVTSATQDPLPPPPPSPPETIQHLPLPTLGTTLKLPTGSGLWTNPSFSIPDGRGGTATVTWSYFGGISLSKSVTWSLNGTTYVTDPNGNVRIVSQGTVDTDPGYITSLAANGTTSAWKYDPSGKPTSYSVDDGQGNVTTYNYDSQGHTVSYSVAATDSQGKVSTTRYDALGRVIGTSVQVTDAQGQATTTNFDAAGNSIGSIVYRTDGEGNSVQVNYDASGTMVSSRTTVVTGADQITITSYDAQGKPTEAYVTSHASDGTIYTNHYDANGNLTGSVVATPDASGNVVTANYDAAGKLTSYVSMSSDDKNDTSIAVYTAGGIKTAEETFNSTGSLVATTRSQDGTSTTTTRNADRSYTVTMDDGRGTVTTTNYSAQDIKLSDSWRRADGSYGTDTFNTDGTSSGTAAYADGTSSSYVRNIQGQTTTNHFAADGKTLVGSTVVASSGGNVETDTYDASGAKVSDVWSKTDGTSGSDHYQMDGSHTATVDDGYGGSTTVQYDAKGVKTGDSWTKADGTSGNDAFYADGSYSSTVKDKSGNVATIQYNVQGIKTGDAWTKVDGTSGSDVYQADGSYSSTIKDAKGNVTTTMFNVTGVKTGDTWTKTDGTSGSDAYNIDGSYSNTVKDANGNVTTTMFSKAGIKTGDSWSKVDGSSGTDTLNSDGSSVSTAKNADGTSINTTKDAFGNTVTTNFNQQGVKISDSWTKVDGSRGTDAFNGDGSGTGTVTYRDGSTGATTIDTHGTVTTKKYNAAGALLGTTVTATDADGTITTTNFDSQGVKTSDTWQKTDGSYGSDTFNADGSSSYGWRKSDGTYGNGSADGKGNTWSWSYFANGKLMESASTSPDGSASDKVYKADGSAVQTNHDANDNISIFYTDTSDKLIGSTWTNVDGSYGSTTVNPDGSSSSVSFGANGQKTGETWRDADGSNGQTSYDGQGHSWSWTYDANGRLTEFVATNPDGSYSDHIYGADGSSTQTTHRADGGIEIYIQDANSRLTSSSWKNPDGSYGENTYGADGSSSGSQHNADGTFSTSTDDGHGDTDSVNFAADGTKTSENWRKSDGSYGSYFVDGNGNSQSYTYDANGSLIGMATTNIDGSSNIFVTNPDGSRAYTNITAKDANGFYTETVQKTDTNGQFVNGHTKTTFDGKGNSLTFQYDQFGSQTGETWRKADGTTGAGDGGYSVTSSDGEGSTITAQYNLFGVKSGDSWIKLDGSHGSETINPDGGIIGSITNADGTSKKYSYGPDGHRTENYYDAKGEDLVDDITWSDGTKYHQENSYDANGFNTGDTWTQSDGSHGYDIYNADGTGINVGYNADGSWYIYNDFPNGYTWKNSDGSYGEHFSNANGSFLTKWVNADGSYRLYTDDRQGDWSDAHYDENGFKLSENWHKSDGSGSYDTFMPPEATPILANALSNQTADQAKLFAFTIPTDTFAESVAGDALTISVTRVDGTSLPSWLTFDATTGTLSGIPDAAAVGGLLLKVTATDAINGLRVSSAFNLTVNPASGTPVVNGTIADQSTDQRQPFQFVIPASVFTDTAGNTMSYSATLADGSALPTWLKFDAQTGTFSGTPGDDDVGALSLKLTAADPDGQTASTVFKLAVNFVDRAPVATQTVVDQAADELKPFSFTLPAGTFTDADKGDTLTYSVTLADGSVLPDWLRFDPSTATLSGTPDDDATGTLNLTVVATDNSGQTASTAFKLTVNHVNEAPTVANTIGNQHADELTEFSFIVPADTFTDANKADTLVLSAAMADGSALPSWLNFDAKSGTFSGTSDDDSVGTVSVKVTATDPGGLVASTTFDLAVNHVDKAPVVVASIADQSTDELAAFKFVVPSGTFIDANKHDTLALSATLADGTALPAWLVFDAATGTFSGTPEDDVVGAISLKVMATDPTGLAASEIFNVTVNHVDKAPEVAAPIAAKVVDELKPFTFVLPSGTFTDPNQHDTLSYSATLADGTALPSWLTFDGKTGTFSGTPDDSDTGVVNVKVTATDPGGLAASSMFALTVNHVNLAPAVVNALTDQATDNTKIFTCVLPADTFADPNKADTLTYSATLADGKALPSWLTFDAKTGTFSGQSTTADAGVLTVVVTATDQTGLSASASFKLTVDSKYLSPVLAQPIADQVIDELKPFQFTIPTGTFADPNAGGVLTYSATLADGSALPSWLTFDAKTGTFSGTPGDDNIGTINVKVMATDSRGGLSATDTFALSVNELDTLYMDASVVLPAHVRNLTGTGTSSIVLTGNTLDNVITANDGNDTLIAGSGVATLVGGGGNDTFVINNVNDVIVEKPGAGINTVQTLVSYVLPANVQNIIGTGHADLTLTGNDLMNVITANDSNDTLVAGNGIATLVGGAGNDTFMVNNAADVVQAKAEGVNTIVTSVSYTASANVKNLTGTGHADIALTGNDLMNVITANDGNDTLVAGAGRATLIGGSGNNTFVINNVNDVIIEAPNAGIDTVMTSVSYVLPANVQNITAAGTANVVLQGNDLGNVITANDGNDTLIAGSGPAILIGGAGNDTFVINNTADVVQAKAGGINTIQTSVSFTASANVKNLTGTGNADLVLTGNDLANVITANSGNDTLIAGGGVATLIGGAGNNTFMINNINDIIVERPNNGIDTVVTSVSYVLPADVENITGAGKADIALTGNSRNNVITANDGNDTLIAGTGVATLVGGAGNDTFVVNNIHDVIIEKPNGGTNTVKTSVSYTLSANLQNMSGAGTADLALAGNELANMITANGGNDTLTGGAGNDTLVGGTGNTTYVYNLGDGLDTIVAGSGKNTLRFGKGLSLDNAVIRLTKADGTAFQLTEDGKSGHYRYDKPASGTWTLTAHLNVLDPHGAAQLDQGMTFTVTVDSQGNITSPVGTFQFADGSTVNLLDMLVKTDTIRGDNVKGELITSRNDDVIYAGLHTTDVRAGAGNDTIYAGSHGTLAYGGGGNNDFIGGDGNDTFVGGWGMDVMQGGKGNDNMSDTNGLAAMLGGKGSDTITGGAFHDFIAGGDGSDQITTGSGANVVAFNKGGDQDTINASAGAANTLSLGGGINEADLTFSRNGNDLVLHTGDKDSITFKGWYADAANHGFVTLQIVEAASKTYDPKSANVLVNQQVETFDFAKLVAQFDQAQAANAKLSSWNLMNGLLSAHLSGSDTAALGGDLAYYYGMNGDLSGMDLSNVIATVQDAQYGKTAQKVNGWNAISKSGNTMQ